MRASEFINLIDYRRQNMNVKGATVVNNLERIIITSVQHPETIYSGLEDQEPRKQWLRRMEIIDLSDDGELL